MSRISRFYEALPRGPAPVERPMNPLDMYRVRYFGDKPSAWRKSASGNKTSRLTVAALYHIIGFIMILGYGEAYYFHLRMFPAMMHEPTNHDCRAPQEQCSLAWLLGDAVD
jgi:hypothetical protein